MRIFYASDVHGSEVCWRKFLNAGAFYGADALIMGGDLVGKALVPIIVSPAGSASAVWDGRIQALDGISEIEAFETTVRNAGFYPARMTAEQNEALVHDEAARGPLFEETVRQEFSRWLEIAEEKANPAVGVFVMAGNDDPWFIDDLLAGSPVLTSCDDQRVYVGQHEMISLSYSNPTPWNSPRELAEDALYERIERLTSTLTAPADAIFNLHVPPYASGLDEAPLLREGFRPRARLGQVETGPVGSTAVRRAIETYQPLVGLHGHIHESRGTRTIGRTTVINPGSEYTSGRIHGALFETLNGSLKRHQLVIG